MPIYKQTIEITSIDDLLSSIERDIEEVYFGDKNVFTVWGEYDGTLPAQYSANGSALADYRVYGSAGGVGDDSGTAYGYEVDMAIGNNILQGSEIEQGGWQAASGTVPVKIVNPNRCRSKGIYTILGKKILYDFKALNVNIAFIDSTGISMGGTGFKTGTGGVDVPANAVKCLFIIANTNTSDYINPAQVIATGIWAKSTIPIYIGSSPLGEDEYVDYGEQKVYKRTAQLWDYEKITVTVGERYGIIVPNGQYSIRNDTNRTIYVVRDYGISGENIMVACEANSTTTLTAQSLQTSDIRFYIGGTDTLQSGVTIVAGSTVPSVEIPYLQSTDPPVPLPVLPTVDGTNIVEYVGQSAARPNEFFAKYRKQNF